MANHNETFHQAEIPSYNVARLRVGALLSLTAIGERMQSVTGISAPRVELGSGYEGSGWFQAESDASKSMMQFSAAQLIFPSLAEQGPDQAINIAVTAPRRSPLLRAVGWPPREFALLGSLSGADQARVNPTGSLVRTEAIDRQRYYSLGPDHRAAVALVVTTLMEATGSYVRLQRDIASGTTGILPGAGKRGFVGG